MGHIPVARIAKWKGWKSIKRLSWGSSPQMLYHFLSQPGVCKNLTQLTHLTVGADNAACDPQLLSLIGKSFPNLISLRCNSSLMGLPGVKALLGIGPDIIPTPTNLPNLTTLHLAYPQLCQESLSILMSAEFLPKLANFRCSGAPLTSPMVITTSPKANHLTALDLSNSVIPPDQLIKLASSPSLTNLTHLNLANMLNRAASNTRKGLRGDDVALALIQSPYLTNLVDLNLGQFGNLHDTNSAPFHLALEDIFNSKPHLQAIELLGSGMDPGAIFRGAQCPDDFETIHLQRMSLGKNPQAFIQFLQSGKLSKLKVLDLGTNQLGDGIVNLLFRNCYGSHSPNNGDNDTDAHPTLPNLTSLKLANNAITADGCEHISKANPQWFPYLSELVLGSNPTIGSAAIVFLSQSPCLTNLTQLDLQNCGVDDGGVALLADSVFMSKLTKLNLSDSDF